MAGKRNANRLRKSMEKNNTSGAIKKAAEGTRRAAQRTAVSTAVKRGASAAQSTGRQYGKQSSGREQQSYINNSKLQRNNGNNKTGRDRQVSFRDVMERNGKGEQKDVKSSRRGVRSEFRRELREGEIGAWNDVKKDVKTLGKGTVKRFVGSEMLGIADNGKGLYKDPWLDMHKSSAELDKKLGIETPEFLKRRIKAGERADKEAEKFLNEKGKELKDSGQKNIDKVKKGKGSGTKFAIDVGTGMAEIGMDALATGGKGTMLSMFNRAYGASKQDALDEGATEKQAKRYGYSMAGLEVATEKIGSVATPLKKLYGKGASDELTEKVLNKITSRAKSGARKEALYNGGKVFLSSLTEGLEEMVSEGLEPTIANAIYAEAIGNPHSTSVKDILYSGAVGGTMGGLLGGAGQAVSYNKGKNLSDNAEEIFGEGGLLTLVKKGMEIGEETGLKAKAAAYKEMIESGEGIANGQVAEFASEVQAQMAKDQNEYDIATKAADNVIKTNRYAPITTVAADEYGMPMGVQLAEGTQARFDANKAANAEVIINTLGKEVEYSETQVDSISDSIAAIQTGVAGVEDINLFNTSNPAARTAYEAITGVELPETNKDTKRYLFEAVAKNKVASAEAETALFKDRVKGLVQQDMAVDYSQSGQELMGAMAENIDISNPMELNAFAETFDNYYNAGRASMEFNDVVRLKNPSHEVMSMEDRRAVYEAGLQDRNLEQDNAMGMQIRLGETAKEVRTKSKRKGGKGRLISELSNETRKQLTASEQRFYRMMARTFGVDIHIVDDMEGNGTYEDGVIYMSMNADRDLEYVFAHEITHHMQAYAPEQYVQFKNLIRDRWTREGGIETAIQEKMEQYERHGKKLNEDAALDEIIADSTYEMIQDEAFIEELCKEHRSIAQSLLDAIKGLLSKIRTMLAEGDRFTPRQNEALLSELDILKDAEKLWTDGLMAAAENRGAVGQREPKNPVVRISAKDKRKDSIRTQLKNNLDELNVREPVSDIRVNSYKGKSDKQIIESLAAKFKKIGMGVDRQDFGFISLDEKLINNSLNYLNTEAEYAAFETLPKVLKKGIELRDQEHKGRGYNTVTIAAPVVINGKRGNVAVVVKKTKGNRYKTHRILMPDGSEYVLEHEKTEATTSGMTEVKNNGEGPDITSVSKNDTEPTSAGVPTTKGSKGSAVSSASNSIPENSENSKKQFSLPESDSEGNKLTEGQREYFANSKVVDDSGRLMKMHHGTMSGEFYVFDKSKARPESDSGAGFYFTNNNDDANDNYGREEGADLQNKIDRRAEQIESEEDIDYDEAREVARNEIVKEANYFDVYLNVTNPVYVGERYGDETLLLADDFESQESEDAYDDYDDYIEAVDYEREQWFGDEIDNAAFSSDMISEGAGDSVREILWDAVFGGGISFEDLKSRCNERCFEDDRGELVGNEVARAVAESLGYDGIIDSSVASKWGSLNTAAKRMNGVDENTVHVIVFNSEQIKNIDNQNPTDSPDIRFSLKEDSEGNNVVVIEEDIFEGREGEKRKKVVSEYLKEHVGEMFTIIENEKNVYLGKELPEKYNRSQSNKRLDRERRFAKQKAVVGVGEMIEIASGERWEKPVNEEKHKKDAKYGFYKYDTRFAVKVYDDDYDIYNAELVIRHDADGKLYLYDIQGIKKDTAKIGLPLNESQPIHNNSEVIINGSSNNSIRNNSEKGNSRFSLPDETSVYDYVDENITEFVDATPVRDYERTKQRVKNQTYDELVAQVEKLSRDKRLTHGKVLDKTSIKEAMNDMVRTLMTYSESYTSDGKLRKTNLELVKVATENAPAIYKAIKDGDYVEASTVAYETAREIVENLELVNDSAFREYKKLRDYLRTTSVSLSEQDSKSIPDYSLWRKKQFGRLRIVKEGGIPVDTMYAELCEVYPELFDAELTHPADQLMAIAEAREALEPYDIMLSEEVTEQLIKQTAQDILDISATGKPWKSFADKFKESYETKLKLSKERHKEAIRDVKIKERMRATRMLNAEKAKARSREEKKKAHKEHVKHFGHIEKNWKWLADRLLKPTDDKHIPEEFKVELAHLLQQFDLQTGKSKSLEEKYGKAQKTVQMDTLRRKLAELAKEDGSGVFEYDGYVFDLMDATAERINGRGIDELSNEDLKAVDILLKSVRHNINNYNKAFSENIKENISALAEESISKAKARASKLKNGKYSDRSGVLGGLDSWLNESMVTPRDFFERLGGGMEKVFMSMRKGFDKHVDNMDATRKFFDELFKPYHKKGKPGSEIEKWRDSSQVEEFSVYGGKISLSPAQVMTLYCLSKRKQALGHILGSGIVAGRVDSASKIKQALGAKIETNGSTVMVTMDDIVNIIDSLSDEQRAMADRLQEYLNNECAEWGNEVSMKLYGYKKFTEENYFPIKSADAYLDSNFEGRQAEERIKNFGFTKGTVIKANNPIMIDDIFRATADHINKMSLYNAFAAPISDFTRVYNFKARDENGNLVKMTKAALGEAYGKKAINYIDTFMSNVNSQSQTRAEGFTRFIAKSMANYKKATIGGNMRVALQQPTAIARAFTLISPKYFVNTSVNIKDNLRDMKEHCQIARWKAWGHSQVDMARDIDDIMMNNEWSKIDAVTMELYGALDNVTWSTIWAAVKAETKAKYKDVEVGSEEFYRICNDRASEIFDKTQVVDSVFHRSQVMRSTDVMSKMVTSFMAEPTRTFNMMRTEYALAKDLWQEGEKGKAIAKANRATSVFVINAALVSAAAAVADALRGRTPDDDDEDDSWFANFLANFWDNVNPVNMIPLAKDMWGFKDGWGSQNMALEGYASLIQSVTGLASADDKAEAFRKMCESIGLVTGLPIKNVLREAESIFNVLGINVFAAEEGGEEETEETLVTKVLESIKNKFRGNDSSSEKSDGKGNDGTHDKSDKDYYGIYADEGAGLLDRITDKSKKELRKEARKERVSKIKKDVDGLSGEERKDAIWNAATKNYTKYIADGEFDVIKEMRRTLEAAGGDVEHFDKKVKSEIKTCFKKTIGKPDATGKAEMYRQRLINDYGYTEGKISQEIVAKSETATDFQKALCMNDVDSAVDSLSALISAGITYQDAYILFEKRTDCIKASDFNTGELAMPVTGTITSGFGGRQSPGGIGSTDHKGVDIAVAMGTDVAVADGGKVAYVGYDNSRGNYVRVSHGNGRETWYLHLSGFYVQKGEPVAKGQIIAASGSTGNSTGPHLHFEVRENGTPVDPMIYFSKTH